MPTLTFYPNSVSALALPYGPGNDINNGIASWDDGGLSIIGPPDAAYSTAFAASMGTGTWFSDVLYLGNFVSGTTTLSNLPPTATLTAAKATLRVRGTYTGATMLAYTRIRSGATNSYTTYTGATSTREGGFSIPNGAVGDIALHNQAANPILCSRSGSVTMRDLVLTTPGTFGVVIGFLTNGGGSISRQLEVDSLALEVTWATSPTADRSPFLSGLLASRFRRFART